MSVELNHTIVCVTDREKSAGFLAGPFAPVWLADGVTLDYLRVDRVTSRHYAFLVGEADFDAALARIERAGALNDMNGGRGLYFEDPDGHNLELLTRG
ncbi:VOC family protein [Amycolatopsis lexingtonensis]|uniref:VOC family protein n=1 Tax=Amycolatopsis lexingtonensis TaxID=218822 RepID=UPI003F6E8488